MQDTNRSRTVKTLLITYKTRSHTKTADERMKTMKESEQMEKEKFPETENKEESNTPSGNKEQNRLFVHTMGNGWSYFTRSNCAL